MCVYMHVNVRMCVCVYGACTYVCVYVCMVLFVHSIVKQNQGHHVNRIHRRKIVSCTPNFCFPRPQFQYVFIDHGHTEQQLTYIYTNPNHIYIYTIQYRSIHQMITKQYQNNNTFVNGCPKLSQTALHLQLVLPQCWGGKMPIKQSQ